MVNILRLYERKEVIKEYITNMFTYFFLLYFFMPIQLNVNSLILHKNKFLCKIDHTTFTLILKL